MSRYDRIGVDIGRHLRLEEAIDWAAAHRVRFIDIQLDTGATALTTFDAARAAAICARVEREGLHLGLHTSSAVNVAEYAPFVADAVDAYLRAYIDLAPLLGARTIVVHAGFHFTADLDQRMEAGRDRLKRAVAYAEPRGVVLLLENLNREPAEAEVHYLAHSIAEWRHCYEAIDSPAFALSFTANHAHLMPDGLDGFLDAIPLDRVREVRLADCFRNGIEQHLIPGEGDFDFGAMFRRIEGAGYRGHYMNAFADLAAMQDARTTLVELARRAGVE